MIVKIFPFSSFLIFLDPICLEGTPKFIETLYPVSTVKRLHVVKDAVPQLELNLRFFQVLTAMEASDFDRFVNRRLTAEECPEMAEFLLLHPELGLARFDKT